MPRLENPQLELLCQKRAKSSATDARAYRAAGYKTKNAVSAAACASRLLGDAKVAARIGEIKATALPVINMTRDEVLQRISHIAFSNIGDILEWGGTVVRVHKDEISGVRKIVIEPNKEIGFVNSSELDDAAFAAVREIRRKSDGSIILKMYSKLPALRALGKHLGLFDNRPSNETRDRPSNETQEDTYLVRTIRG